MSRPSAFDFFLSLFKISFVPRCNRNPNRLCCSCAGRKKNGNFVLWKKNVSVPNLTRWQKSWKADFNNESLMLKYSRYSILLLNFGWIGFVWGPLLVLETRAHTHTHTAAVAMLGSCSLAWPVRSVARTTAALTSHSPERYPVPGTRGAPWTDIPTAKKKHMYLEAHQLKITQAYI